MTIDNAHEANLSNHEQLSRKGRTRPQACHENWVLYGFSLNLAHVVQDYSFFVGIRREIETYFMVCSGRKE